jgi:hypothetical protein
MLGDVLGFWIIHASPCENDTIKVMDGFDGNWEGVLFGILISR